CQELLDKWPMPFYISPSGQTIKTGHRLLPKTPETNPVREAYRLWDTGTAITDGRSSWDQVAVLFVARPDLFAVEHTGSLQRLADGNVAWNRDLDNPNHHMITPKLSDEKMAVTIEGLMASKPKSRGNSPR
ncbi:MAG: hypothetical protein ACYC6Y_28995, partial [Thermoguttaceae bacterium]